MGITGSIFLMLLGAFIGGIIGYFTCLHFYIKSGKYTDLILRALESNGIVRWHRNTAGEIIGICHNLKANAKMEMRASASLAKTVIPAASIRERSDVDPELPLEDQAGVFDVQPDGTYARRTPRTPQSP